MVPVLRSRCADGLDGLARLAIPNRHHRRNRGVLGTWALYGLSGAGVVRRLPLLRPVLLLIGATYVARGLFAIPMVLLTDGPYAEELRARMPFLIGTSLVCLALGFSYAIGAASVLPLLD